MGKANKLVYRQNLISKMQCNVEQKEIQVGSVNTAYLVAGEGAPLICLHGAGAGAVTWYPSIGELSKSFQVIAPDIVGYGESDKPDASYDKAFFSQWLKDFLLALKISKAHIVGLSQGGAIALQFAIDNPEMVDKLALIDSAGLGAKVSTGAMIGTILMNSFPSSLTNSYNSKFILHTPKKRDHNHLLYSVEVLKSKGRQNAFKQGRGSAVSKIPEESLKQIQSETLVIWGKDDRLFGLEYGEAATKIIPNASLHIIPEAGHLPLIDQTELFNNTLLDFLIKE